MDAHPLADQATPRSSEARTRLLDAAEQLFYVHGINSTGVDAVIAAADVARMTLYKQFGGKAGLVTAYLDRRDARWWGYVDDTIAEAETPTARLLGVFDALEQWCADNGDRGCAFANAAAELTEEDHSARAAIVRHKQAVHQRFQDLARAAGVAEPDGLADQLFIVFEGAISTAAPAGIDHPHATATSVARALISQALPASG